MPPSSRPSFVGTTPQPSVLLLEEYDALAAAIGSALKKFAVGHSVTSARSLGAIEAIAGETPPDLLIVDVDPAWPGLVDFLQSRGRSNPNTRVLIIGGAIPAEITDERGSLGALQFISKPFELAEFGAAVQALLGPWHESESSNARGTLRAFNLIDVVLLQLASGSNAIIEVEAGRREYGEIHFVGGQISHVEANDLTGIEAFREMLGWAQPDFHHTKRNPPGTRTVVGPWTTAVVEALRNATELRAALPSEPARARPIPEAATKNIVVVDDTEMLRIFVEDVLATSHPEWKTTSAATGASGCKEVERVLPDLVLLDYSLPDLNGDEVCRRLLQNERTAHVPVLMMSGHVNEMNTAAARFENIVATIEKPFFSEALVDLVQRTLEGAPPIAPVISAPTIAAPQEEPKQVPPLPKPGGGTSGILRTPLSTSVAIESSRATSVATPVIAAATDAVLGVFLDVVSMQFTPQLQMGTIRAKPSSSAVSLHLPSTVRESLPVEIGFELGRTDLDANGHITTLRVVPTTKPFQPAKTRNALEIGEVAVVPGASRERVQLIPAAPMTMQLLAHLDLAGVELSSTFQVTHVVLRWRDGRVRVTFSSKATESQGASFEIAMVQLDPVGRISELVLNPIR